MKKKNMEALDRSSEQRALFHLRRAESLIQDALSERGILTDESVAYFSRKFRKIEKKFARLPQEKKPFTTTKEGERVKKLFDEARKIGEVVQRDGSVVTVSELLQYLDKAKGKITPYNGTAKKLERLRRAIDEAFI